MNDHIRYVFFIPLAYQHRTSFPRNAPPIRTWLIMVLYWLTDVLSSSEANNDALIIITTTGVGPAQHCDRNWKSYLQLAEIHGIFSAAMPLNTRTAYTMDGLRHLSTLSHTQPPLRTPTPVSCVANIILLMECCVVLVRAAANSLQ